MEADVSGTIPSTATSYSSLTPFAIHDDEGRESELDYEPVGMVSAAPGEGGVS